MAGKLRQLAEKALDRAEVLKAQEKLSENAEIELPEPPVDGIFTLFFLSFRSKHYFFILHIFWDVF